MEPLLKGMVFAATVNSVRIGATAGMGYGLGRKYGRKMCEFADNIEGRLTALMIHNNE